MQWLLLLLPLLSCRGFVYDVVLLSCVADSVVRATAGLVEWLSDELQREFNTSNTNPLLCKYVGQDHSSLLSWLTSSALLPAALLFVLSHNPPTL